ncbi:YceI family protein [Corynebacterium cystitidis]|uniref:YceI family protein n=1 Tax=Corynebacterium cystitidis TaxID=35757 RepID=UPI00211DFCB5|nr:YceI family protein [Corynebacterium cystitidis]
MQNLNGTFDLDRSHSSIGFSARHAMVTKIRGRFNEYESVIVVDEANPENNKATATIKVDSIDTGNADRDKHVKDGDFFAVDQYPEITFTSTKFKLDDNGEGTVEGDLTIRGITKPVTLDVEVFGVEVDAFGVTRAGFEASTKINRKDFGIDFHAPLNSGGVMISEQIALQIDGSAVKREA